MDMIVVTDGVGRLERGAKSSLQAITSTERDAARAWVVYRMFQLDALESQLGEGPG